MSDNIHKIEKVMDEAVQVSRSPEEQRAPRYDDGDDGLPVGCPVVPLGLSDDTYFYMDACRQLRSLKADKHGNLNLKSLFAPKIEYCEVPWPRYSKPDKHTGVCDVVGTDWASVGEALMNACGRIGPIDLDKRVRGSGAWLGGDGELVMHCGDLVFAGDQAFKPGKIGNHVYPAAPALPYPSEDDADGACAQEVLSALKTWNWARPDVDPHLMLGWIGAAMMGGALDWRPLVWVTGDKATGKSTLQKLVNYIITDSAMVSSVDASAAGIRQNVGRMSLPVALDELEAEEDNRRSSDVVKLARFACSGGQSLRGGADHKGSSFTLMNCFMFSSILIPPMLGQDISRMAILRLDPLEGVSPPSLKPDYFKQIGMQFRRRLMSRWGEFNQILEMYRGALAKVGHSGRSADQFGTLLACHDILMHDFLPCSDSLDEWGERLEYATLSEASDDLADWERCLDHILTSQIDFFRRGERKIIADLIAAAAGHQSDDDITMESANKALRSCGMAVHINREGRRTWPVFRVANAHQGLGGIFRDTHWGDKSGASGVWAQSLQRVPGAVTAPRGTSFAGSKVTRFIEIPIERVLDDAEKLYGGSSCAS